MPTFTTVNPVAVNRATKVEHYDVVFDNTQALQQGTVALTQMMLDGVAADPAASPSGDAVIYYNSTLNQIRYSKNGGSFFRLDHGSPIAMAIVFGG